jgi:hypothetical protein
MCREGFPMFCKCKESLAPLFWGVIFIILMASAAIILVCFEESEESESKRPREPRVECSDVTIGGALKIGAVCKKATP